MNLMARHIPPTDNRSGYQLVKLCENCERYVAAADTNPFGHICPRCGSIDISTIIARWIRTSPRWQIWNNKGVWQVKGAHNI